MASKRITDTDKAWQALRALKHRPPDAAGRRWAALDAGSLSLANDGGWDTAGVALAGPAHGLLDRLAPATGAPGQAFVVGQIAQSLDGRTATAAGCGDRITGAADQERLHQLRALVDAVVVGSATALADEPRLTVRAVPGEQPTRIVLDRSQRLPSDHPLLTDTSAPTRRVVASPTADDDASTLVVPDMAPASILTRLAGCGLHRVLVEGGGRTVSRFLEAGCMDRLHLAVAPVLIGRGPSGLDLPPSHGMEQARRPAWRQHQLGDDVLFDLDLRRERSGH